MRLSVDPYHLRIEHSSKQTPLRYSTFQFACSLLFFYFLFPPIFMLLLDLLINFHLHKAESLVLSLFFLIFFILFNHSSRLETQILLYDYKMYFYNQCLFLHFLTVILQLNSLMHHILRFLQNLY